MIETLAKVTQALEVIGVSKRLEILESRPVSVSTRGGSSSGGSETLAQTLALGNTTGGTDLVVSTGDKIIGQTDLLLSDSGGNNYYYAGPTYLFQQWYNGTNSTDFLLQGGGTQLYSDTGIDIQSATGLYHFFDGTVERGILDFTGITTSDKTFVFPDTSGTIALTGDLTQYFLLAGRDNDVANIIHNDIQVTSTQGFVVANNTASDAVVTAQWSPAIDILAHAWYSGIGSADRNVRTRIESQTLTHATTPFSYFTVQSSTDTGTPSWTKNLVLHSRKTFIDQSVSGTAANNMMTLDTVDTVTSAGSGATPGFTWLRFLDNGTLRMRIDWSGGSAIRFYAPGRVDFESAGQMFFSGSLFFLQAHSSLNRSGDAGSTATQKDSKHLVWQNSLWTGSAGTNRYMGIMAKASTTVNLDARMKFFLNVTGGVGTEGTEVASMWWDNTLSQAKMGIGVSFPTATLHLKAGGTGTNAAPLQFDTGSLETTARGGLVEYNNRHYVTNSSLIRHPLGGTLFDQFADSSVGGAEADIYTNTTAANTFAVNGDKLLAEYGGNFVTVGTELTQLKVYFAGTAIWDSTGVAPVTGTTSWRVFVDIIRVSSTVVRYSVSLTTTGATGYVYTTVGELTGLTLSGTNILKITGTSTGVGSGAGDIVGKMGYIMIQPAN